MKLAIISHTEHYKQPDGTIVGWGPTITELNYLLKVFDEIYHVAMLYKTPAPKSALPYVSKKITFVPIPAVGGKTFSNKMTILTKAPKTLNIIHKTLQKVDYFQFRAPTGIGVYAVPYLAWFTNKKGWFKYAGNWAQKNPPFGYALQRFFLQKQSKKVTINGKWNKQKSHLITFENPCLTEADREKGAIIIAKKQLNNEVHYCFVGGLNNNKGALRVFEAFKKINTKQDIFFHVVGSGNLREELTKKANELSIKTIFYGSLPHDEVKKIYAKSHFFILASLTEGFPKVLGEAMNYGCVPVVSNISCIPHYIKNNENGFLFNPFKISNMVTSMKLSLQLSDSKYKQILRYNFKLASKFTYSYYLQAIQNNIL